MRLVEGDFARETVYGDDPVAVARDFERAGAAWVHVVDLDAARTGDPVNRAVVAAIARAVSIPVQCGGGVRSVQAAADLLESGVARVVIGTAAVERPALVAEVAERWPGRVAVGLDHRGGMLRLRGWEAGGEVALAEVLPVALAAGASAFIVTDIGRDGTLSGPDLDGLAGVLAGTEGAVIASGGVGSLADLKALSALRGGGRALGGAIIGKALYEGRFGLTEALQVAGAGAGVGERP